MKHIPANSKILDVGCGYNGKFLYKIKDKISAGFGIDISVNQERRNDKITLAKHDLAYALPFANNTFDVVISLANLEHLHDPAYSFEEIHRVLKPGGVLLLTTPSVYAKPVLEFLSYKLKLISEQEIRDHKQYTNKRILTNHCERIGFSLFKHSYFQFWMNNFLIAKK